LDSTWGSGRILRPSETEAQLGDRNPVTRKREIVKRLQPRHMRRLPLGMSYPDMVAEVCGLIAPLAKAGECTLVVDAMDLIRRMGPECQIVPVTITGANRESRADRIWSVPKCDLVIGLQVMFQEQRLQISGSLKEGAALLLELMQMRVKISDSGHDSYGCWREGAHDDLALAC
jgi:hypothetical protein